MGGIARLKVIGIAMILASLASICFGTEIILVGWTFPSAEQGFLADQGIPTNRTQAISGMGDLNGPNLIAAAETFAASYSGWDGGAQSYHWRVAFSTVGFTNITLSSKQRSSNTGPRDFRVDYRIGSSGGWSAVPGAANIVVGEDYTSGGLMDVPLPANVEQKPLVQIRWVMTSETSVTNGTVSWQGTSAIDDIIVRGMLMPLPPPEVPVALPATFVQAEQFVANWQAVSGNFAGYELEVATTDQFRRAGATVLVDFEGSGETKTSYATGTNSLSGLDWLLTQALIGTLDNDWKEGLRSLRLGGHEDSTLTLLEDVPDGLSRISFPYRRYGTDPQVDWRVDISTDQGQSWNQTGSDFKAPDTDTIQTFSADLNIPDPVRVRIRRATMDGNTNTTKRLNIDNIMILPAITASDLVSGYDPTSTTQTSIAVTGLPFEVPHYYRVRTVGLDDTRSDWSNIIYVTVRPPTILILY